MKFVAKDVNINADSLDIIGVDELPNGQVLIDGAVSKCLFMCFRYWVMRISMEYLFRMYP